MPLPNSSARGFGACSTSYAPDNGCRSPWCSAVRSQRLCRRKTKCSRRKTLAAKPEERETWTDGKITGADYGQTSTQRLFEGEAELAQYGQARTTTEFVKASKFDADHIRHRVPLLDEKKRYDWAESIESSNDWQSFFRDDGFDFEDPELDDTYDGLKTGTLLPILMANC